jgi:indolepyruvate ferredoxin oxidoreductase
LRKRGELPAVSERVVINERVCEGCGDCGEVSTCLSVQPVATEFGRKTHIHQASCNSDLSCLQGDCPSFLLVEPGRVGKPTLPELPVVLVEPVSRLAGDDTLIRMPGIGGTGVVTTSQILQWAAHLDGGHAAGLEQTGLAQKGGPVVSDLRFSAKPLTGALRASRGRADVVLGFDLLGAAADPTLQVAEAGRTIAVLDTAIVPTAEMVTGRIALPGSPVEALTRVESATDPAANLYLDAQGLAQRLFADHMPAGMLLVGAAFQHGCLPMGAAAIERAIELNGTAVATNLAAFRWGRAAALDPAAVAEATTPPSAPIVPVGPDALKIVRSVGATGALHDALATRVADLIGYQDETYARRYAHEVRVVADGARTAAGVDGERVALAFARGLHKLMAYKDEYEVARLHLDPVERARRDAEFGADASISVLLHPPVLRALGMQRKLRLRRSAVPTFRVLRALRGLRGTRWDVFGYAHLRRVERALVGEYRDLVRAALDRLRPDTVDAVLAIAELTDLVRGYEDIKLSGVAAFRERAAVLLAELDSAHSSQA